jgi:hypothetical protein
MMMKAIALLLIIGILASADQGKTSQSVRKVSQFDYATQIGIVFPNEDKQLRLEIKNPNLAANDEIVVVVPFKGKRQWHRYFYLGYDVEPNCTEDEGKGMADK